MRRAPLNGLPSGPRIPVVFQSYLLWRHWIPYLDWCRRRYGPVFTTRVLPTGTVVYVCEPEQIKEVFTGDSTRLHAGEGNEILGAVLGSHSLLLLDEDEHLRERKLMLPPFHGHAVTGYRDTIAEIVNEEIASWPQGEPIALHPRMQAITLEVILRVVFGVDRGPRLDALREMLPRVVRLSPLMLLRWIVPRLDRFGPWRRYCEVQRKVDRLLYDEIADRRAAAGLEEREDVLSRLVSARFDDGSRLSDGDLRDELMTLLLAGHETTAAGLAWTFERLVRHPQALERLLSEIDSDEDRGAYLDAVIKESLRVRPVIADVVRKLTAPMTVAGHRLPAGVVVSPAISVVQRSPHHYPAARDFRPERFLDGDTVSYAWIPFGGGTRRCIGAAFATLEMKVVLWRVLSRLELTASRQRDERIRVSHVTMVPHRGAEVIALSRVSRRSRRERDPQERRSTVTPTAPQVTGVTAPTSP